MILQRHCLSVTSLVNSAAFPFYTSQKTIKAALEESEQLRKQAQRLALPGHWRLNPYTSFLHGTGEFYQISELPKGAPLNDFDFTVHPDDRESASEMGPCHRRSRGCAAKMQIILPMQY